MWNINKTIKNNFRFFFLLFAFTHLFYANVVIFTEYWEEKLYWLKMRTGKHESVMNQTHFSFEDYDEYGTKDWIKLFPYHDFSYDIGAFLICCFLCFLFVFYILVPCLGFLVKKKKWKIYNLTIDIFLLLLLVCINVKFILERPMIGVIPCYIFIPIIFFISLIFRICQYETNLLFVKNRKR